MKIDFKKQLIKKVSNQLLTEMIKKRMAVKETRVLFQHTRKGPVMFGLKSSV